MKLVQFSHQEQVLLGVMTAEGVQSLGEFDLGDLLRNNVDLQQFVEQHQGSGVIYAESDIEFLPPVRQPGKVICIGLNYTDHTKESNFEQPDYPTVFPRFNSSLMGAYAPMIRPKVSDSLDYEGELAVILNGGGRHISKEDALQYVAGYSVFNDGSVREYQFKSPQWTVGKNFDDTGSFGPVMVTADALPAGAKGLLLETRLNGEVVQSANTSDMVFDVASLISILSDAITLEAGDVIVAGTPAGVGWAREPRLLMRDGDVCEVSIEQIGTLRNPIVDEK